MTAAPFLVYLIVHSLHDRVEAHWPAPLYAGFAILAAWAAETAPAKGYLAGVRRRAAPVGLAIAALVVLHLAVPATDVFGPDDPALGFRGWNALADRVEAARKADGAAWVGALSYGVTAQLAATHRIKAPVIEVRERKRYPPGDASWSADLGQPGLIVDLTRRVAGVRLGDCFGLYQPRAGLTRGDPGKAGEGYGVASVYGRAPAAHGDCDRVWRTRQPEQVSN